MDRDITVNHNLLVSKKEIFYILFMTLHGICYSTYKSVLAGPLTSLPQSYRSPGSGNIHENPKGGIRGD